MDAKLYKVLEVTNRISLEIFNKQMGLRVERDNKQLMGRIFLQVIYYAHCRDTGKAQWWHGRKWYLSEHMTNDEIIKTAYAAFEAAVKHEVMEGFKVDGKVLFNPHVNFEELLKISHLQIQREPETKD